MIEAIDFHDEPRLGSGEVRDEPADDDLTPKLDAELPTIDCAPQPGLAGREIRPLDGGVKLKA